VTDQPQPDGDASSKGPDGDASSKGRVPLASIGGVVALGGFALVAVEVIRTLTGGVLGTIGTTLLWVGVGVLAVGLLLLVLSLAGGDDETPPSPGAVPAPETPSADGG
jgi:hypothetical protein